MPIQQLQHARADKKKQQKNSKRKQQQQRQSHTRGIKKKKKEKKVTNENKSLFSYILRFHAFFTRYVNV